MSRQIPKKHPDMATRAGHRICFIKTTSDYVFLSVGENEAHHLHPTFPRHLSAQANTDHGDNQKYDRQYDGKLKEGLFHSASSSEDGGLAAEDATKPLPLCLKQYDYD